MMMVKGLIPRRSALGLMGSAVLAACQGAPAAQPPVAVGAGPTAPPQPEPAPTIVLSSENFARWLEAVRAEARQRGISQATIAAALGSVEPLPQVVELDRRQPEFSRTFTAYMNAAVTARRAATGRAMLKQHAAVLAQAERDYNVPARFLVAFWGLETDYGNNTGSYSVIAALATLAFDGRREALFRAELFNALTILDGKHIPPEKMLGSWAGAMGHSQFMPSSFLKYGVDRDGDGRIDMWQSLPDIFGSKANYLHSLGWDSQRTWGRAVKIPPGFDAGLSSLNLEANETVLPLSEWTRHGVTRIDGGPLPRQDLPAALILPQGIRGPAFVVYDNYRTILRYNRSTFYAVSIGVLADQVAGGGVLQLPASSERPLSREEMIALQEGLIALQFLKGKADGILGADTRQAVRRFQRARGLPPDGYADRTLLAAVASA